MKLPIILVALLACQAYAVTSKDFTILKTLQSKKSATVIVSIKGNKVDELNSQFSTQSFSTRAQRLTSLYTLLKNHADSTQSNILNILNEIKKEKPIVVRQLWISNEIIVRNADHAVVEQLLAMDEVTEVREEQVFHLDKPINQVVHPNGQVPRPHEGEQWGIAAIRAPEAWAFGNKGAGVVVATIDSGVRYTHEALKDGFLGEYGWFDPYQARVTPHDAIGHGTHTMGTIVGRTNGIGVAPEAQWMACRGCYFPGGGSTCFETELLECGQFVTCPTDVEGNNPDCSKAPNLVSNSWGGGSTENPFFDKVIMAWKNANIAAFFSIGNSGADGCGTAGYPGDSEDVIGVGATTILNEVAEFSSRGPTYLGQRIKPDFAAPGADIVSAHRSSDDSYRTSSGTSMASPHVAGLAALLYSENINLTSAQIRDALIAGAQPTNAFNVTCEGISDNNYPNHNVGYGRVDALASLQHIKGL